MRAAIAVITGGIAATQAGNALSQQLEEVMVTATKRTQAVQEIPMSIQAVSGESLQQRAITNMDQLSASIPSFQVGDGTITTSVSMRGMGSQPERGFEQSVGMFIDGIYMPRSRQYRAPFMDAARVEVLRGPQAVLFGLNSTAGAINVVSNSSMPGDAFSAEVRAGYEMEYGSPRISGYLGGSVGDSVGLRLAAQYRNDSDGFYDNVANGKNENAVDELALRGTAVFQPGDATMITLKLDYADFEFDGDSGEEYGTPYVLDAYGIPNGNSERRLNFKRNMDSAGGELLAPLGVGMSRPGLDQESLNVSLNITRDIGDSTLTAIAGYSDLEWQSIYDLDFGPYLLSTSGIYEEYEQKSVEIRWTSPSGKALEWIVGGYYMDNELDNGQPNVLGSGYTDPVAELFGLADFGYNAAGNPVTPVALLEAEMGSETTSLSAFLFGTWNISETLRLTGGARWVDTEVEYSRADSPCTSVDENILPQFLLDFLADDFFCFNAKGYEDDRSSSNLMPELAVEWDFSDEIMLYAKASRSAKSGGYAFGTVLVLDAEGQPLAEYDDEEATGYELGMKGSFGNWELNGSLFRTEFDDLQVNTFDPVTAATYVQNAAEVVTQGIELDARWAVNEYLTLTGAYTYLDAEYKDFDGAPCAVDGSVPPSSQHPAGICDASGRRTPYAPEHGVSAAADLVIPVSENVDFLGGLYVYYSDEYYTDSTMADFLEQDSYTQVDARLAVGSSDGRWELSLIGSNLTDEKILNSSQVFFANAGYLKAPRTYLLQASYRFEGL